MNRRYVALALGCNEIVINAVDNVVDAWMREHSHEYCFYSIVTTIVHCRPELLNLDTLTRANYREVYAATAVPYLPPTDHNWRPLCDWNYPNSKSPYVLQLELEQSRFVLSLNII